MYSSEKEQISSVTEALHLDTEVWDMPCVDATTVLNQPRSQKLHTTANWVMVGNKCISQC